MVNNLGLYNPSLVVKTKCHLHSAPSNQLLLLEPWKEALGRHRGSWVDLMQNSLIFYAGFSRYFHVAFKWSPHAVLQLVYTPSTPWMRWQEPENIRFRQRLTGNTTTKPMLDLWTNIVENNCVLLLNSCFPGQYLGFLMGSCLSTALLWFEHRLRVFF